MKSIFTYSLLVILTLSTVGSYAQRSDLQNHRKEFREFEFTVKLKEGLPDYGTQTKKVRFGIESLDEIVNEFGIYSLEKRFKYSPKKTAKEMPVLSRIYKLKVPEHVNMFMAIRAFSKNENVEYAERIPISYKYESIPNDPQYGDQYHLPLIMSKQAWEIHKGEDGEGEDVVIAMVDTGTEWTHEDLIGPDRVWQNLGEDADGDGHTIEYIDGEWVLDPGDLDAHDNDENGYTDDLIGWDFFEAEMDPNGIGSNPDPAPHTDAHGSRLAGVAFANTNNEIGVSSISYNGVQFMAVKVDDGEFMFYDFDGVVYAAENGADIINCSWGQTGYSQAAQDLVYWVTDEMGAIMVAAAGNGGPGAVEYPAHYMNVVSVTNTNQNDVLAPDATTNLSVDICAPGTNIHTTSIEGYHYGNGSSYSSPIIAGSLALLKSYHPDWTNDELLHCLLSTADNIDEQNPGQENLIGTGRVNAHKMLLCESSPNPFIKLDLHATSPADENGNGILEAGETVIVNLDVRNLMMVYGADNANITITTDDPDITIIDGDGIVDYLPDAINPIIDQFEIVISENAQAHYAEFNLHSEADIPILVGQDLPFRLLIEPSGYFVYDALEDTLENALDFSGEFIHNHLIDNGYNSLHANEEEFPETLLGFEGVFLCYGNFDSGSDACTDEMAEAIIEFMDAGGDVYVEGGDVLGWDQPENTELFEHFGVAEVDDGVTNPISYLEGQPGSIFEGMVFTDNSQNENSYIDEFINLTDGIPAFVEGGYGTVAVQKDAIDYQSIIFSYAIKHLSDGEDGATPEDVLGQIIAFFNGTVSVQEADRDAFGVKAYPNPTADVIQIQYTLVSAEDLRLEVFNTSGMLVESTRNLSNTPGQQLHTLDISKLPSGIYSFRLIGNEGFSTGKFTVMK